MNADARKKDKNNFINIILNKITLAKNFHQRVALAITSKVILKYITLKFYIRRRHSELYLYIRTQGKFSNITEAHNLYRDFVKLIPELQLEGTKGHYKGWLLHLTDANTQALIKLLKIISLLSRPKDFTVKDTKIYRSYVNYPESSAIPIHLQFTKSILYTLQNIDLINLLFNEVEIKCSKD